MNDDISRRDFISAASLAALSLSMPGSPAEAVTAPAKKKLVPPVDATKLVDPELKSGMDFVIANPLPKLEGEPTLAQLVKWRDRFRDQKKKWLAEPAVEERIVPVTGGAPDVKVFVINAKPVGSSRPAILHTHGGGFILGNASDNVWWLQELAHVLDCVIVTVEYRLSPETHFPAALEDNYAALKWLHTNANELGVNATKIAVAGESAGGGHAAMLAIAARDRGEVPVIFQSLVYPMLDDRTASTIDPPAFMGALAWNREWNRLGWTMFLGRTAGGASAPAGAVPARVANLAGLPPAWIGVGAIDLFLDEDVTYARRLMDSAVPTELLVVPGAFHAFDGIVPDAGVSRRFTESRVAALVRAFK